MLEPDCAMEGRGFPKLNRIHKKSSNVGCFAFSFFSGHGMKAIRWGVGRDFSPIRDIARGYLSNTSYVLIRGFRQLVQLSGDDGYHVLWRRTPYADAFLD